ncbi:MAG: ATP-binding protein [Deltaproteobacteria bacterium]|nr:ATP-binding protein [Deltaproteobacteria bacterium]
MIHFKNYLEQGGIVDRYKFGPEFLQSLFSSIINRDIIARYRIRYPVQLQNLAQLLMNSFSSKSSPTKLAKHLNIKSPNTVRQYIQFLENSFLIFGLHKFSFKLKEQQASYKKMYSMDLGLARTLDIESVPHESRYLENLVAIELKRRCSLENHSLYYWDNYHKECDFVVMSKNKITKAIQVCWELNPHNEDREFAGLVEALKTFRLKSGTILTLSSEDTVQYQGHTIHIQPVWKWLWVGGS